MNKCLGLIQPLWPNATFETASEGQAAALYICTDCIDLGGTSRDDRNNQLFDGLDRSRGVRLLVVDVGASTLVCLLSYYSFPASNIA